MDTFTLIVLGGIVVVVAALLAVGLWHPRRALEITDQERQKRWGTQAEIEERDIPEMVEGQNAYRRRRGAADVTEADAQRAAASTQRDSIERATRDDEQPGSS